MKGIGLFMFIVIIVISAILAYFLITNILQPLPGEFANKSETFLESLYPTVQYSFDRTTLIRQESNFDDYFNTVTGGTSFFGIPIGGETDFCRDLKKCIIHNIESEVPCIISDFEIS